MGPGFRNRGSPRWSDGAKDCTSVIKASTAYIIKIPEIGWMILVSTKCVARSTALYTYTYIRHRWGCKFDSTKKEIRGKQESHDERLGLFHRRWSGNDRHGNYSMAGNMIAGRTAPDMWDAIRKKGFWTQELCRWTAEADALQYKGLPMSLICFNASLGLYWRGSF